MTFTHDQIPSIVSRLQAHDTTLWPESETAPTRLGWLSAPTWMTEVAPSLAAWAAGIEQRHIVLLGMGGSTLGPLVLSADDHRGGAFTSGSRQLTVIDTTEPTTISSVDLSDAYVVVSSKSGTTIETEVLFAWAFATLGDPSRFAVITDVGSPLIERVKELGITTIFENPTDIGGRYSLFSYVGMVPAALLGYDVAELCQAALDTDLDAAVGLGIEMASSVERGQDKIIFATNPKVPTFGLWAEQLIAESTGKDGTGAIPVPSRMAAGGSDRFALAMPFDTVTDLAQGFFTLEVATAICGAGIHVDPFNEPNVAESKQRTLERLAEGHALEVESIGPEELFSWLDEEVEPGAYVALQAFLPYAENDTFDQLRDAVAKRLSPVAVTAGFGPRYLHSTGQLHKGGPASILAVQLLLRDYPELEIPGRDDSFGQLITAQADGDYLAMVARGRKVVRVVLDHLGDVQ